MEIKILSENSVFTDDLTAEHGLSIWFKYNEEEYLFDTGQGYILTDNAEKMEIYFNNLTGMILSHNHYDHIGGARQVLEVNPDLNVITHPDIIEELGGVENATEVEEVTQIGDGIWLTGKVPTDHISEDDKYYQEIQGENSLFLETYKGLVVLLGCSHAGVVNILDYIQEVSGKKIDTVIGGMHLVNKDAQEVEEIVKEFERMGIQTLYPLHCTGFEARRIMCEKFSKEVNIVAVGDTINL